MCGVVGLEERFRARLREAIRPPCPPGGGEGFAYEFMTAVYWPNGEDPRAGRRYAGHHAEIVEEQGRLARVAVYPPGSSTANGVQPQLMWIDLTAPEQCDAGRDALTTIGVGAAPKRGALFLIAGRLTH